MGRWNLGFDGGNTLNCGLAEEIAILGDTGYTYHEIRDYKLADFLETHTLEELRSLYEQAGVQPICMSAIELKLAATPEEAQAIERNTRWLLESGAALGCPMALAAHIPPIPSGLSDAQINQLVAKDMLWVSDIADECGMRVPYEFLGGPTCPIHTIADTMEVLDLVNRENVGWLFDIYHFHLTDGSLEALAKSDAHRLMQVHLTGLRSIPLEEMFVPNSRRALPGEGPADTAGILETLARIGFEGPIVIELYDKDFLKWNPRELVQLAKERGEAVLDKWFRQQD